MPLSQDPKGGGSEADGTLSTEYCSFCYRDGAFVSPDLTLEGMIAFLGPMMDSMKMPQEVVAKTKAALPSLKRWRTV